MITLEMQGQLTHMSKNSVPKSGEKGEYIKTIWGVGYKFIVE